MKSHGLLITHSAAANARDSLARQRLFELEHRRFDSARAVPLEYGSDGGEGYGGFN